MGKNSRKKTPPSGLAFEELESRRMLAAFDFPLVNASFESPDLDPSNSYHNTVDGWTVLGFPGTTYEVPAAEPSPATDGEQFVYGASDNWSIRQTGPTIAANTRYILSVDLYALDTGTSRAILTLQDTAFFELGTKAYRPTWDAGREDFELPEGEWTTVRLGINSSLLAPSAIGRGVTIIVEGSHIAVDNVKLTVDDTVHDFYISSSQGSQSNDGFSAGNAWSDFSALDVYGPLMPGERILLKAGDVFHDELNIRGKGTANDLVELTSYGEGANPIIRRQDTATDVGVIWNNASNARISNIDVEHSKLGVYLRYEWTDSGSTNVTIENSNFRDMPNPTLDASEHNFEYAWSDAIWVGGQAFNQAEFSTRLDGLTTRNVTATNTAHLFGTGWYFPAPFKSRLTNLVIEDSVAYNNLAGAFQLFGVDGGRISRVHSYGGGGQDTWSGTTLGFIQDSRNVIIEDSEFSYIDRAQAADGSGMDFEGNTENITFRNNVVHSNAGSGLLVLSTGGPNTNLVIENNTFYNNAVDPWNSEINSEVQGSNDNHTGIIRNNSFYRADTSINFLSPGANWNGFTITDNRELEYPDVRSRPTWWDFNTDGDFEGWSGFNQWGSAAVVGGSLTGQSTGTDTYVQSPPTWASTNTTPYAWVRMSQTAGNFGQFFFITDADPVWNAEKSLFFSITPDGQMHDYFIDFGALETTYGVITQVRLDPTIESGSDMQIDFLRLTDSTDLNQLPPPQALPDPQQVTFTSIASEDGHILESSQNSGVGGSVSSTASTFRLGDDSQNRAYRQFLSFDTSALPDNAVVTQATIGITRIGNPVGSIPIGIQDSVFGNLYVDLANPGFGASSSLSPSDWQSGATEEGVSKFAWPAYANNQTLFSRLDDEHTALINNEGRTQFRVRYENDDDGDFSADYMSYATSNYFNASARPSLEIEYFVPSLLPGDYDANGTVDQSDYSAWIASFGATSGVGLLADGNSDGVVDIADYTVWRDNLGASLPASAQSDGGDPQQPALLTATAPAAVVAPEDKPEENASVSGGPITFVYLQNSDQAEQSGPTQSPATESTPDERELLLIDLALADTAEGTIEVLDEEQSDSEDEGAEGLEQAITEFTV